MSKYGLFIVCLIPFSAFAGGWDCSPCDTDGKKVCIHASTNQTVEVACNGGSHRDQPARRVVSCTAYCYTFSNVGAMFTGDGTKWRLVSGRGETVGDAFSNMAGHCGGKLVTGYASFDPAGEESCN